MFEDTPLEYHAKLHGMGLWVVRGALPPAEAERYFAELEFPTGARQLDPAPVETFPGNVSTGV